MANKNLEMKKAGATERARSSAVDRTEVTKQPGGSKNVRGGTAGGGMDNGNLGKAKAALSRQSDQRER